MNNKLIAIIAAAAIVLAGVGVAYALTRDNGADGGQYITDARGREVAIPDEIDSILAIKSCSLQLVSYFDAVKKVTHLDINESFKGTDSRTHTFVLNDLLSGLPVVDPNDPEQVIRANVDIVISSTISVSDLDNEQNKYGVPVFAINADVEFDSDVMYDQIIMLGKLFKEEKRAENLVNGIKTMISSIWNNVGTVDERAYVCGMNYYGPGGFLKTSGDYLPFEYSKLNNVYESVSGKQPYNTDIETVVSKNPQIIFIDGGGLASAEKYIKDNARILERVDAVSNGNVYKTMVYKSWGTNWINQLINVYFVASVIHPDVVGNFNEKANEIIQLFYPGTTVTYSDIANAQMGGGCGKVSL
ncbi:MAG: ABC transporter substrate-binding protein [Candidatus Methanoplasma sp.]|nr:ABC transporter substrate-binding protein [Candidatus Methanoplasma sp.]